MKHSVFTLTAALALASPALAADSYNIDKTHTNIIWAASHMGFSNSLGQFMEFDGGFILNEENPENSSVELTIQTASIMTGLPKFDEHLKSADFFDVETFPTAEFKSTKVELTGDNSAKIHGELTMLGKTHPLVLNATKNKIGINPYNKAQTAGFSLTGQVDRSLYGMNYAVPGIPAVVDLMIEAEGIKQTPNPKDAKE